MTMSTNAAAAAAAAAPAEDPNWRNVGNWHWVSKDVSAWARMHAREATLALRDAPEKTAPFAVTDVGDVTGDCALNIRKGGFITIYMISLRIDWTHAPTGARGTTTVTDLTHDAVVKRDGASAYDDELEYRCELVSDAQNDKISAAERAAVLSASRDPEGVLMTALRAVFATFSAAVINAHGNSIYIQNATASVDLPKASLQERLVTADMQENNNAAAAAAAAAPAAAAEVKKPATPATVNTEKEKTQTQVQKQQQSSKTAAAAAASAVRETLVRRDSFDAPTPSHVIDCFCDWDNIAHWGADIDTAARSYTLLGGALRVTLGERAAPTALLMRWRARAAARGGDLKDKESDSDAEVRLTWLRDAEFEVRIDAPRDALGMLENMWREVSHVLRMRFGYAGLAVSGGPF